MKDAWDDDDDDDWENAELALPAAPAPAAAPAAAGSDSAAGTEAGGLVFVFIVRLIEHENQTSSVLGICCEGRLGVVEIHLATRERV